jgi:hypothetical protein
MVGPGQHEYATQDQLNKGNVAEAQVHAILALASAVNRLASAHETIANT